MYHCIRIPPLLLRQQACWGWAPITMLCVQGFPAPPVSLDIQENNHSFNVLEALLESCCRVSNKPSCMLIYSQFLGWIRNKQKVIKINFSALSTLFQCDCIYSRQCPCITTPAQAKHAVLWGCLPAPYQRLFHFYLSTTSDELESR